MVCRRRGVSAPPLELTLDVEVLMQRGLGGADGDLLPIGQDGRLDGSSVGDRFLWRNHAVGLLAREVVAQDRAHPSHARGASDEDDLVYVGGAHLDASQHLPHWRQAALEELGRIRLELRPRDGQRASGLVAARQEHADRGSDIAVVEGARAVALVIHLDFETLSLLAQRPHRLQVRPHATCGQSLVDGSDDHVEHERGEVLSAETVVSRRRHHLEDAVVEVEQGDVEGAAANVVDHHRHRLRALVQAVGHRCGSRLVYGPQHVEPREGGGASGRADLRRREANRHREHDIVYLTPDVALGSLLELADNEGANLLGREGDALAARVDLQVRVERGSVGGDARDEREGQAAPFARGTLRHVPFPNKAFCIIHERARLPRGCRSRAIANDHE
mmetsp:Transcript_1339/g.2881  ORF Transcript_1339/g.2881 Transcript_1339/m.2881 type:complete len:390 (-) Transcript_1339:242-1411(-)